MEKIVRALFVYLICMFTFACAIQAEKNEKSDGNQKYKNSKGYSSACACSLDVSMERFKVWLKTLDKNDSTIRKDVEERRQTILDTTTFPIDTSSVVFIGKSDAPVCVIAYVAVTCPLCKKVYKELYNAIMSGPLVGKAKIGLKPFMISQANLAFLASARWKRQSDIMLALADEQERITVEKVIHVTDSLGIPHSRMIEMCNNPEVMKSLERSYNEAKKNGVSLVPTLFINGHRYSSYKDSQWIIDAIENRYRCENRK